MSGLEWVMLTYRLPREPSTPRISVWRKLKRLGVAQLLDGLVALPENARTREHLEWIADEVEAAGGDAAVWIGRPTTRAQERQLAAEMARQIEAEYDALIDDVRAAATDPDGARKRTAAKLRRELKRIRQRDYFPQTGFERAVEALDSLEAELESGPVVQ